MTPVWGAALAGLIGAPLLLRVAHTAGRGRWPVPPIAVVGIGVIAGVCAIADVPLVWPVLACGLPAAIVDAQERRLPDTLTAGLALTTTATIALVAPGHLTDAVWAAVATAGVAVTTKILTPAGIGWGDVKILPGLAGALAAAGPVVLYRGVLLWVGLLAVTVGLWSAGRAGRGEPVPFGPAFVAGTLGALLLA